MTLPNASTSTVRSGRAALRAFATPATGRDSRRFPLLFLHAAVCDSRMWRSEFEAFGASRRVAAFDRRGFGETPAVGEPYADVDDAIAVMDALAIDRAIVVGSSNGGRIALDAAVAHPERVAGLVLACAAVGGAPAGASRDRDPRLRTLLDDWKRVGTSGDAAAVRLGARVWLDGPLEPEGRVGGDVRRLFVDMLSRSRVAPEPDSAAARPETAYARLPTLATPTLVVRGALDVPDVTATMAHAAATIPGARSLEVADAAHLPNLERPDLVDPAIARFADELG